MPINPSDVTWDSGPPPQQHTSAINPADVSWDGPAVTPQSQGFSDEQKAQVRAFIPKAKDGADLERFARTLTNGQVGVNNADEVVKYYKNTKNVPHSFTAVPGGTPPEQAPEPDVSLGDYVKGAAENVGRGFVKGLGFIDDALNPVSHVKDVIDDVKGIYHAATGGPTPQDIKNTEDRINPGYFESGADTAYTAVAGKREAKNALQRYINSGAQGVGGALIPMGELNGVRGVTGLVTAGATGGVAGQAATDAFPDSPLAATLAQLIGAHVGGTPFALGPMRDNSYVSKNAGLPPSTFDRSGTPAHAEAANVAQAAQALKDKAVDVAPDGLTPKGRGSLTVTQINRTATKPLLGMTRSIKGLAKAGHLDPDAATALTDAIQNRDGITKPEIDALRGTTEGDAVAEALMHYRAVQNLTKPFGGSKPANPLATMGEWALNLGAFKATGDPFALATGTALHTVARAALRKLTGPEDVNSSRIRGADKAINQLPRFQRITDQTGPTQLAPALDALKQKVADSAAQTAADQASAAAAKAAPKRSLEDTAIQNNMDQGLKGYHRAYADSISAHLGVTVQPAEVLAALKKADLSDVDPFQLRKFEMEHKVSPAAKAAILPRVEQVLRQDQAVMGRSKPAPAKAAESPTTAAPSPGPAPSAPASDIVPVVNKKNYERGVNRYVSAANRHIEAIHSDPEIPNGIKDDVASAAVRVRDEFKTKQEAHEFIDDKVLPDFEIDKTDPKVIALIRQRLYAVADDGKPHATQADYLAATRKPPR